jgi:hypothetical protein
VAEPLSKEERERIAEIIHPGHFGHVSDVERYEATVQALEAERDRLRAALEWYANRHNYEERVREFRGLYGEARRSYVQPIEEDDYGARARAALAPDPPAGT